MGTLRFRRPAQYADFFRNYQLFVDGVRVGEIDAGWQVQIAVPAGIHEVVARLDWCSSNTLRVAVSEGATHAIEVGTNLRGWRLLFILAYITILRADYLYVRPA